MTSYTFFEPERELTDDEWRAVLISTNNSNLDLRGFFVVSNVINEAGGGMLIQSRLNPEMGQYLFEYANTNGTLNINKVSTRH